MEISKSFLLLLFVACFSCSDNKIPYNSEFYDFGHKGMEARKEYLFYPFKDQEDSTSKKSYNINLILRYSDKCEIKCLPLDVEAGSLWRDSLLHARIPVRLFDDEDNVAGKGNYGVFETEVPVLHTDSIMDGMYISISTLEKHTDGIVSLGIVTQSL